MVLDILYKDDHIVAINKPAGLLVHRSKSARQESEAAMILLRDQINQWVYPVHRLDRPTSGVLLFALCPTSARALSETFISHEVTKKYQAIVRGYAPNEMTVDYPLKEEIDPIFKIKNTNRDPQSAKTIIKLLAKAELPICVDKYPTSRYSLVEAIPITGRRHQIRRHLRHLNHPIIGDINHGSGVHNKFFETEYKVRKMLLSCTELTLPHPIENKPLTIKAPLPPYFQTLTKTLFYLP